MTHQHPSMLSTVAGIKRALTPGTPVRIVNHLHPHITRTTTVHAKTNTVDLCTYATNKSGTVIASHMGWPKKKQLRMGETPDTFHVDHVDGETHTPFLTVTVLDTDADVPAEYRAARIVTDPPMRNAAGERIFTPDLIDAEAPGDTLADGRAVMYLNAADAEAFGNLPRRWSATVVITDTATGTHWTASRASCGAGCFCAARVRPAA